MGALWGQQGQEQDGTREGLTTGATGAIGVLLGVMLFLVSFEWAGSGQWAAGSRKWQEWMEEGI